MSPRGSYEEVGEATISCLGWSGMKFSTFFFFRTYEHFFPLHINSACLVETCEKPFQVYLLSCISFIFFCFCLILGSFFTVSMYSHVLMLFDDFQFTSVDM